MGDRQINNENEDDIYLTAGQVAAIFRVDPKTVTRWAKTGKLPFTRTLGGASGKGHRRYLRSDIRKVLKKHQELEG